MFQMTVDDAMKVHENLISVAGPCLNKYNFSSPLVDNFGNVYEAHIPLGKTLVFDDSRVILGIYGKYDVESFKGRMLVSKQA